MMRWDAITGDFGVGLYGHVDGGRARVAPADRARRRLFIAPAALWITLDAGRIA